MAKNFYLAPLASLADFNESNSRVAGDRFPRLVGK